MPTVHTPPSAGSPAAANPATSTTFRLLRQYGACTDGYRKLAQHIRDEFAATPEDFGLDRPIPLATVLKSNGLKDALWCIRATIEPTHLARRLACDFAEHVLPIFERRHHGDDRPRKAIEAARAFMRGEIDADALAVARRAADADAAAAADAAADAAAYAAAADAYAAAADAAAYAAAAAAERAWQTGHMEAVLAEIDRGAATAHQSCAAVEGGPQ